MHPLQRFHSLIDINDENEWCSELFNLGNALGFNHTLLALVPKPGMKLEEAFLRSNYAGEWRDRYDRNNMAYVDPTVAHCMARTTSLVWSPEIFQSSQQQEMYEEARSFGLRSGVTLPIHGPKGELGILCFVTDQQPGESFTKFLGEKLPELSLLRDVVFDSGINFARTEHPSPTIPSLTKRELEVLHWIAQGKTTWEVSKILICSEATINFHVANFRQKLEVNTRSEAIIKAIRLGIIGMP